jgi:hypothetical protein
MTELMGAMRGMLGAAREGRFSIRDRCDRLLILGFREHLESL